MKNKIMICIGIIFVAVVLVFGVAALKGKESTKELKLTYKTNGGVPYKWEYEIEDETIVKLVKTENATPEEDKHLDGGPVYINYTFKGLKEGETTITFRYVSIVDNSIDKEERVNIKVDKNKNISQINKAK